MPKKIKCIKCGLRFKDRQDAEEVKKVYSELCQNCKFIWKTLGMVIQSFGFNPYMRKPLNREVTLKIEDLNIRRSKRRR